MNRCAPLDGGRKPSSNQAHAACQAPRMPAHSAARSRMSPAVLVMMLTLLLGNQPVTTDLYPPALHTDVATAKASS